MLHGNVRSALNSLTSEHSGAPLHLDSPASPDNPSWLVLDELKKNPVGRPVSSEVLLPRPVQDLAFHPVIFDTLDGSAIRSAALRTRGAAGPSRQEPMLNNTTLTKQSINITLSPWLDFLNVYATGALHIFNL